MVKYHVVKFSVVKFPVVKYQVVNTEAPDRRFTKIIERLGNDWISFLFGMLGNCLTMLDGKLTVYKYLNSLPVWNILQHV